MALLGRELTDFLVRRGYELKTHRLERVSLRSGGGVFDAKDTKHLFRLIRILRNIDSEIEYRALEELLSFVLENAKVHGESDGSSDVMYAVSESSESLFLHITNPLHSQFPLFLLERSFTRETPPMAVPKEARDSQRTSGGHGLPMMMEQLTPLLPLDRPSACLSWEVIERSGGDFVLFELKVPKRPKH